MLVSYLYSYTRICTYGNAYTTKVQVKTRLASTVQAGVQPVPLLATLELGVDRRGDRLSG